MSEIYPFYNMPLPYAYNALEPFIDARTMYIHHNAYMQSYINNLNTILENYPTLQHLTIDQMVNLPVIQRLPTDDRIKLEQNLGGVYNHRLFFDSMTPEPKLQSENQLFEALINQFNSFINFKNTFTDAAMSVFGSGYAWLGVNRQGNLIITTSANQNVPNNICPILNLDIWEHAYFLKHTYLRINYIYDWWNVVNWTLIEERFLNCII
jgi:Fe-Mn family superoxide dismutase